MQLNYSFLFFLSEKIFFDFYETFSVFFRIIHLCKICPHRTLVDGIGWCWCLFRKRHQITFYMNLFFRWIIISNYVQLFSITRTNLYALEKTLTPQDLPSNVYKCQLAGKSRKDIIVIFRYFLLTKLNYNDGLFHFNRIHQHNNYTCNVCKVVGTLPYYTLFWNKYV